MGLVVSVVAMLGLFIAVSPAYAASTCDVTAGVMTIDIASGGTVTVGVNVGGAKFVVTGVSSTDATECNVTFATITGGVHVNGAAGNETLVLDMTNGDYDGFDTFVIDLSTGSSDLLSVLGTSTGDTLTFGAGTATLDGSDATLAGVDKVSVDSNGGADTIDGGTLDVPMTIRGGTGADSITGGVDDDLMFGGSGSDDFFDSTGYDTVSYADHGGGVTVTTMTWPTTGSWQRTTTSGSGSRSWSARRSRTRSPAVPATTRSMGGPGTTPSVGSRGPTSCSANPDVTRSAATAGTTSSPADRGRTGCSAAAARTPHVGVRGDLLIRLRQQAAHRGLRSEPLSCWLMAF